MKATTLAYDYPAMIPCVSLDFFLESVIPIIPADSLNHILNALESSHGITDKGRPSGFNADPVDSDAFQSLHDFSSRVLTAAEELLEARASLVSRYTQFQTPWSERTKNSRPDAFLTRVDLAGDASNTAPEGAMDDEVVGEVDVECSDGWEDIVVAGEFTLQEKDCYDSYRKIMWSARHILRNDPRREFTFGITIVNTACRFWFFARSHIMVSTPFNFITDSVYYVKFLVGLAFAHILQGDCDIKFPLSSHGYDPSARRSKDGQYSFRVGDTWYIADRVLSNFRAESIRGRCTRVWEVHADGQEDTKYVLKDVWVDRKNATEGEIWEKLKAKMDGDAADVFKTHFLTLINSMSHEDSRTTCSMMGRREDNAEQSIEFFWNHTLNVLRCSASTEEPWDFPLTFSCDERIRMTSLPRSHPIRRLYIPRKHDRSVWKEVCTTYDDLTSLPLMVKTLEDTVIALECMWKKARAVHRDLSTGNVFHDKASQTGRLGDLEFVKFYEDSGISHDVKTGTAEFMAVEVYKGDYLYAPPPIADRAAARRGEVTLVKTEFLHNPLHDLESVWWLLVWTCLRFCPESPSPPSNDALQGQLGVYLKLFSNNPAERRDALAFPFSKSTQHLASPIPKTLIPGMIESIRMYLYGHYTAIERKFPVSAELFEESHSEVLQDLREMRTYLAAAGIEKLVTLDSLLRPSKRRAEDLEDASVLAPVSAKRLQLMERPMPPPRPKQLPS